MPASKAQRAKTAERRAKAVALRLAGMDYETIAARLDYASRAAAYTDINRTLEQHQATLAQETDTLRTVELMRLDRLQAALWPKAASGDPKAVETVLKIMDRRARLLGLDAPVKYEVLTIDVIDSEIARLAAQLEASEAGETAGTETPTQ